MNITLLILTLAILALAFVLFAWATARNQNAPQRRSKIGNASRKFFRAHFRRFYLAPLLFQRVRWWFGGTAPRHGGIQFANIGEGTFANGVRSYLPDAATVTSVAAITTQQRYLLYKVGADASAGDHVALCGAGEAPIGPSDDVPDSATTPIAVKVLGAAPGLMRGVTDGTIANGDHVKAAANGQITKASTTDVSFGIALFGSDTSSAAGDVISYVGAVPHKYVF